MSTRDALLFAGQGSSAIFEHGLSDELSRSLRSSLVASEFLSACHKAFQAEVSILGNTERILLPMNILHIFATPDSIAQPSKSLIANAIVQSTSLYVHQVLEWLQYCSTASRQDFTLSETSGFCAGLITAVVAAATPICSHTTSAISLHYAIQGFRVAFWIGLRVAEISNIHPTKSPPDDTTWSLVVSGLDSQTIEALIASFNESERPTLPVCIAASLTPLIFTLNGEPACLTRFKTEYLPVSADTSIPSVFGYYHAGTHVSQAAKSRIIDDICRRNIDFPNWDSITLPIRSTLDGKHMAQSIEQASVLDVVLDCILMHRVDWTKTSTLLLEDARNQLAQQGSDFYRIISLGPNARSLLSNLRGATDLRLSVLDKLPQAPRSYTDDDIAIVGMGLNFPSGEGKAQLWETIKKGLNMVEEIPLSRFDVREFQENNCSTAGSSSRTTDSKFANFVDNLFDFDNEFFRISYREARSMDPQQRMLLHAALHALEDAGYAPGNSRAFARESFGVFVGVATEDYVLNAREDIDVYYSTGTLRAFLSGKISYAFDFEGPSVVVDTACSSAAVSIHQACRALKMGDCTAALVGGVNAITSPDMHIGLGRAHFLNSSGQCKPFDASADGYCRAEGCGLFVLKRAADAVLDGDRIYGVIRGVEMNQCGTSKSITYPDAPTQGRLFRRLLKRYSIDSDSISVVEAHGTGTQAGDHAEINSIRGAFGSVRRPDNPLYVSSVKGNIGHAEAASGAAGLAKILLMMQEKQIPPQAALCEINPRLGDLSTANIAIPSSLGQWKPPNGGLRRAVLNNFGAAGSNVAMVIEEHPTSLNRTPTDAERSSYPLNISAKTARAFKRLCQDYYKLLLRQNDPVSIRDICYSATARRMEHDAFRLSVSIDQSRGSLSNLHECEAPPEHTKSGDISIVFVFSGQGALHQGMGSELFASAPIFREAILDCDNILATLGYPKISPVLSEDGDALSNPNQADSIVLAQCACFGLQYALSKLWASFGVVPKFAIGHSLGEYAMIAASGMLQLADCLAIVARRAELMFQHCAPQATGMIACNTSVAYIQSILEEAPESYAELDIACINSSKDCVVAGALEPLLNLERHVKSLGIRSKRLDVPYGFHSKAMDPMLEAFKLATSSASSRESRFDVVSATLNRVLNPGDICSENFLKHARETVNFAEAIKIVDSLVGEKEILFLEIGPSPITLPMVKTTLAQRPMTLVPSLRSTEQSWTTTNKALGVLFQKRIPLSWAAVYQGSNARFYSDTPHYPLFPNQFVIPYKEPKPSDQRKDNEKEAIDASPYSFLPGTCSPARDKQTVLTFHTPIHRLAKYIVSHSVGGAPLCPASVYMELASEAEDLQSQNFSAAFTVYRDIVFAKPLVYRPETQCTVMISVNPGTGLFEIASGPDEQHCTGVLEKASTVDVTKSFARMSSLVKRQTEAMVFGDSLTTRTIYDVMFQRVVSYSGPFISLKQLRIAASGLEGIGTFMIPPSADTFHTTPAFVDTLLHSAGFIANSKVSLDEAAICTSVEKATVPHGSMLNLDDEMSVYCSLIDGVEGYIIADAYAIDVTGKVCAAVEGMHFKILRLNSFQAHLAKISSSSSTAPRKTTSSLEAHPGSLSSKNKSTTSTAESTETMRIGDNDAAVVKLISQISGGQSNIIATTSLDALGFDSLLLIELAQGLEQMCPALGDPVGSVQTCATVADVVALVRDLDIRSSDKIFAARKNETTALGDVSSASASSVKSSGRSTPATSISADAYTSEYLETFVHELIGTSIENMGRNITLSALGIDSLLSIELQQGLHKAFGISLQCFHEQSIGELTLSDLEALIVRARNDIGEREPQQWTLASTEVKSSPNSTNSIEIESEDHLGVQSMEVDSIGPSQLHNIHEPASGPCPQSLFLFHDGSGTANVYSRLCQIPCKVVGVASVDFGDIEESIDCLEKLATKTIARVGLDQVESPIVGGWSFGGVLAFEVARQLQARGKNVKGIILIDSPSPTEHLPLPDEIIGTLCSQVPTRTPKARETVKSVREQFRRNASLLGKYDPLPLEHSISCRLLLCDQLVDTDTLYGIRYPWLDNERFRRDGIQQWATLLGNGAMKTDLVPGDHFSLFQTQHVRSLSVKVANAVADFLEH